MGLHGRVKSDKQVGATTAEKNLNHQHSSQPKSYSEKQPEMVFSGQRNKDKTSRFEKQPDK